MRALGLGEIAESPFLIISRLSPNSTATGGFIGGWVGKFHGFLHNTVLVLPSILSVAYLAYEAKKSLSKLSNRRSYIVIAYYGCLWLVSLLNLGWCCLQAWECTPGKEVIWNLLTLFTTSIRKCCFWKASYIIGLDFPASQGDLSLWIWGTFVYLDDNKHVRKFKWGLWVIHKLLLAGIYGMIFFMYKLEMERERLPGYMGSQVFFTTPSIFLFCMLLFLLTSSREEDLNLENVYYSEMKDAGFFDADWE